MKSPLFEDRAVAAADGTYVCQLLSSSTNEREIIRNQTMVCALGPSSFIELI